MDERQFRSAMGKFATGITIVTTELDQNVSGMTANAFISVSLDPPLILVSVDQKASMHEKLKESGHFGVSILNEDQKALSMHFAKQQLLDSIDDHVEKLGGQPVIKNALAKMACRLYDTHPAGDHTLFICEVLDIEIKDGKPLTYYRGKYGHFEED